MNLQYAQDTPLGAYVISDSITAKIEQTEKGERRLVVGSVKFLIVKSISLLGGELIVSCVKDGELKSYHLKSLSTQDNQDTLSRSVTQKTRLTRNRIADVVCPACGKSLQVPISADKPNLFPKHFSKGLPCPTSKTEIPASLLVAELEKHSS